jgi:hypothetical protein
MCERTGSIRVTSSLRADPSDQVIVIKCEWLWIKRGSDPMFSEVSGGKTHTEQLETGHMDIHSRFVYTIESATYAGHWEFKPWRILK